jgi:D-cysteine desulfhydrase
LASLAPAHLGAYPSPVTRAESRGATQAGALWIKRDDLNATTAGGNKVRALEWLLGGLAPGATVVTGGGEGSTHVLATAIHAARLGAATEAVLWRHEMHPIADRVARASAAACRQTTVAATLPGALVRLALLRLRQPDARYVPLGGASSLGTLGHVGGALELADQIAAGELPVPSIVVVPLGTGGTAAGLALGFGIAGIATQVVAARVVPWLALPGRRIGRLIRATRALLVRETGVEAARLLAVQVRVDHSAYGGAYGRPLRDTPVIDDLTLDATYSAKAAAVALGLARSSAGPVLFWMTFDARLPGAG